MDFTNTLYYAVDQRGLSVLVWNIQVAYLDLIIFWKIVGIEILHKIVTHLYISTCAPYISSGNALFSSSPIPISFRT